MKQSLYAKSPGARLEFGPAVRHREGQGVPQDVQLSFGDLGPNLFDVTFVVVDLETTGGKPDLRSITEFGAVKVRGGEVVGEFGTLVNPCMAIPAFITVLTGITTAMVVTAPKIEEVMPSFLEFVGHDPNVVLVAHNARFDMSHLKAAAAALELPFPKVRVLDTVVLARRTFTRDEVPNYKLGTLARVCGASVTPNHRALDDARATVDVLHAILSRLGGLGVSHLDDLVSAVDPVPQHRRIKAHLADGLPRSPGVYKFIGPRDEVLYVGTSRNLYKRVRQYFTAAEKRRRIGEMVDLSVRVDHIATATVLEANILEIRLIGELEPQYNRRSRASVSRPWITLTAEAHPRLKVSRHVPATAMATSIGPFSSTSQAKRALELLGDVTNLRGCIQKLPVQPDGRPACHLLELNKCSGPCITGAPQSDELNLISEALEHRVGTFVERSMERMRELARSERYEQAATERERLYALVSGSRSAARSASLITNARVIAAARESHGWEIVVIDYGRLVATGVAKNGDSPQELASWLSATHPQSPPPETLLKHVTTDELRLVSDWLWRENVRFLEVADPDSLSCSVRGPMRVQLPAIPGSKSIDLDH